MGKDVRRILQGVKCLQVHQEREDLEIEHLAFDSRKVQPYTLFFCIQGKTFDGHEFAEEAIEKGAVALVVEHKLPLSVPQYVVADTRQAMSRCAAKFYGHPSRKLRVIGITGTNGKTSSTYLIRHMIQQQGSKCGLIGTVAAVIDDEVYPVSMTTPESLDIQHLLWMMHHKGCEYVVMEVSSHALVMGRVDDITFDTAVFTNLTQDHLDFHETEEKYKAAKSILFKKPLKNAIINADDRAGREIALSSKGRVLFYSLTKASEDTVIAREAKFDQKGTSFQLWWQEASYEVRTKLIGVFNVYNSLASVVTCMALGFPLNASIKALGSFTGIDGRFELVHGGQNFMVIVDYAHTPDALANVLRTVSDFKRGRSIVVFGCGGDRDKSKRPLMGEIAGSLADFVIVTSDNPRNEDPELIIEDILGGIKQQTNTYLVEIDRAKAIAQAIRWAQPNDVVLIAGKGHETYQQIGDRKIHFDDRKVALNAIKEVSLNA